MDFITELHNQVDLLKGESNSVDEISERAAKVMQDLGYALATPRLIKDNVKYYLRESNWDNYNSINKSPGANVCSGDS